MSSLPECSAASLVPPARGPHPHLGLCPLLSLWLLGPQPPFCLILFLSASNRNALSQREPDLFLVRIRLAQHRASPWGLCFTPKQFLSRLPWGCLQAQDTVPASVPCGRHGEGQWYSEACLFFVPHAYGQFCLLSALLSTFSLFLLTRCPLSFPHLSGLSCPVSFSGFPSGRPVDKGVLKACPLAG